MTPRSTVPPSVGSVFAGYRIERVLGRGGMGTVYLAEHERLRRRAAIKTLLPDFAADNGFRDRFIRESQLLAALDHPNIIPIYDAAELDGNLFIAMRYVEGGDLKHALRSRGPCSPDAALAIIEQIGRALDVAHASGLVHRDVKPANILLEPGAGRAYLSDFGVAKHIDSLPEQTATGSILGSVDYMSPEQIHGRPLNGRSDIYALACVAFECLSGRAPFRKESEVAILQAQLTEPVPSLSQRLPEVGGRVDEVFATGMAKNPALRYPTAAHFVSALRAAIAPVARNPVGSRSPNAVEPRSGNERSEATTQSMRISWAPEPRDAEISTGWIAATDGERVLLESACRGASRHPNGDPCLLDDVRQTWCLPAGLVVQTGTSIRVIPSGGGDGWTVTGVTEPASVGRGRVFYLLGRDLHVQRLRDGIDTVLAVLPGRYHHEESLPQVGIGASGVVIAAGSSRSVSLSVIPWSVVDTALPD